MLDPKIDKSLFYVDLNVISLNQMFIKSDHVLMNFDQSVMKIELSSIGFQLVPRRKPVKT